MERMKRATNMAKVEEITLKIESIKEGTVLVLGKPFKNQTCEIKSAEQLHISVFFARKGYFRKMLLI